MIEKIAKILLYVDDQETAKQFWEQKAGFTVIADESQGEMRTIEIAPTAHAETSFVLHDKQLIMQLSPELNIENPSIIFESTDIDGTYEQFKKAGIVVGDLILMPFGKVFNFSDEEHHHFAVKQQR